MPKVRESNFELLRVVAILFVLILHADFFSIKCPNAAEIRCDTLDSSVRILIESLTIVAVNVFVMISGWFSIRPNKKGLCNLLFQIAFYLIINYALFICLGLEQLNFTGIKNLILATPGNWFIKAYLILYVLAPVLNTFVENVSQTTFRRVLIGYYTLQTLYGFIFYGATDYFCFGYSPLPFIGLYLLVRYVRVYRPRFVTYSVGAYALIFIALSIINVIACVVPILIFRTHDTIHGYNLLSYLSPTVIAAALSLILLFSKLQIKSKLINRLGTSSFAVYVVYVSPFILHRYGDCFLQLYSAHPGLTYWVIAIPLCILLYLAVAAFDTIRLKLWQYVIPRLFHHSTLDA